jgi:hypothetical protein
LAESVDFPSDMNALVITKVRSGLSIALSRIEERSAR